jgi:starch phosphorylase
VTNGVHTPTWIGPEMRALYVNHLGSDWEDHLLEPEYWTRVREIPDEDLWNAHRSQKERLIRFVRERVRAQSARHGASPDDLRSVENLLNPAALTIGFARRFATYKRAILILSDLGRLRALLKDAERPIQLVFAGKAHPADREGQESIRRLFLLTQGELAGKVVFLEDYDIDMGRMLVQGCDVWLNTPRRPLEASGTSGEKSPVNGGINMSILDGWWVEGYRGDNGWAIGAHVTDLNPEVQDREDADSLFRLLEDEVVPTFFDQDPDGVPHRWVEKMKASIESVVPRFSANRMLRDYVEKFYLPAVARRMDPVGSK